MKELKTIHGETMIIDDEDYEKAKQYSWTRYKYIRKDGVHQVRTSAKGKDGTPQKSLYKQLILGLKSKVTVFKNSNPLDLRRENIIVFDSRGEHSKYVMTNYFKKNVSFDFEKSLKKQGNAKRKRTSVNYFGVSRSPYKTSAWHATIYLENKRYKLGGYSRDKDAALAYDLKALELYGTNAKRNFPKLTMKQLIEKLSKIKAKNEIELKKLRASCKQGNRNMVNKTSKYVGVRKVKNGDNKWITTICFNKKAIYLGTYRSEEEAARAYDIKAIHLYGKDAKLNFPRKLIRLRNNNKNKEQESMV